MPVDTRSSTLRNSKIQNGYANPWRMAALLINLASVCFGSNVEVHAEHCIAGAVLQDASCQAVWNKIPELNERHEIGDVDRQPYDVSPGGNLRHNNITDDDDDADNIPQLSFAERRAARLRRAEENRKLQLQTDDVDRALLRVRTSEEVAAIVLSRVNDMQHTAIRAALNHLAKRRVDWRDPDNRLTKEALVILAKKVITSPALFPLESYPRAVHSFAELHFAYPHLYESLATHTVENLESYSPSGLATSVRAFALSGVQAPELFEYIASRGVFVTEGTVSVLPKLAWSYAVAKHKAPDFFMSIGAQAKDKLRDLTEAEVESLLWAFATQGILHPGLMDSAAEVVSDFCKYYSPSQLSTILWAFSKLNRPATKMFTKAATEVTRRVDKYSAHDIYKVVWAFAHLNEAAPSLFQAVTSQAQDKAAEFKALEFADVLWSFAKTKNIKDVQFIKVMAEQAVNRSSSLTGHQLLLCLWALNSFEMPSVAALRSSAAEQLVVRQAEFSVKDRSAMEDILSKVM